MTQEYTMIPDLSDYDTENLRVGVEAGKGYMKNKYAELKRFAEEEGYSWRVLGFIAGILMTLDGIFGALSSLFSLSLFGLLINLFIAVFGIICTMLEYEDKTLTRKYLQMIERELHFLYLPMGRGVFYVFCGNLLVVKGGLWSAMSGLCILCIGCLIFYSNRAAAASLHELRAQQYDDAKIQEVFNTYDVNGDGCLAPTELANLCNDLGSPLDYNTLESALLTLDVDANGKISYAEFIGWYKGDKM